MLVLSPLESTLVCEHEYMSFATYKKDTKCAKCPATTNLTKDHIIPQSLFERFGLVDMYNDDENLQTLCKRCNVMKGATLDPKNPRTYPLMIKMLDRWAFLYQPVRRKNVYAFRTIPVRHDTTVYRFGKHDPIEELKDIYRKQRATWRTR